MKLRTCKAGRPTGKWRKGRRVTSSTEVRVGVLLIADSHQFEATNLVKVAQIISLPKGFTYTYATPAGDVIKEPLMMAHEFELSKDDLVFYEAQR